MNGTSRIFDDAELDADELAYMRGGDVEAPEAPQKPLGGDIPEPPLATPEPQIGATDPENEVSEHEEPGDEEITEISRDKAGRFARKVPIHALHQSRAKLKDKEAELQAANVRFARADERMNQLLELANSGMFPNPQPGAATPAAAAAKSKNPMDEPDIDMQEDFVAALDQQKRRMAYLAQTMQSDKTQRETQETETQVRTAYINDAKSFVTKEPEFGAAYRHVVKLRHQQLAAAGHGDEKQRNAMIAQEERDLVHHAFKAGKSPAQVLWDYAAASGFQKGAAPATPTPGNGQQQNGNAHAANVAKIAAQKKGQAASASLSGVGGSPRALTLEQIADMNQDEFDALVDKMGGTKKFTASYFE